MEVLHTWGPDIFHLSEVANGNPLTPVTYTIFKVSERMSTGHAVSVALSSFTVFMALLHPLLFAWLIKDCTRCLRKNFHMK